MNAQHAALATLASLLAAQLASATIMIGGTYTDAANCDDHGARSATEELGRGITWPEPTRISADATITDDVACAATDDPTRENAMVVLINDTDRDWSDLFYVADGNTRFSNFDGFAMSAGDPLETLAFRIDNEGANRNLVFESMDNDGVLQAGETWRFIVQDYENDFGLSAAAFFSFGFAGDSTVTGDQLSSASIVQFPVPAPGALALFGLAGLSAARRRR
jgi:uncharacterized protein (TIGR03382 family)